MMVARALLAIAPQARLWDLPLLPPRIADVDGWLSDAQGALQVVRTTIAAARMDDPESRWILLHPWAVFDRAGEAIYGDWSRRRTHPFNELTLDFVKDGVDVVFAAGNCGGLCPDDRCGPFDRGPARSIYGSHALAEVATVAAVTVDGRWAGGSSEGPGVFPDAQKPDFAAPSMFTDDDDRDFRFGGSSAAAAVTAGVVAALRQAHPQNAVPPSRLLQVLRETAARPGGARWDRRTGAGVLDAEAALAALP
jgi:hypothetical protein